MKILVAEDEKQLAHVLATALRTSGYQVDVVGDGQAVIDHVKQHPYDVIILDIMMPVKSGLTALKELRASGDQTYVMILTAMGEEDDKVNGLDDGADDYLTKPFSIKELLARLRSRERRGAQFASPELQFGDLILNTGDQSLISHNSISLSNKESSLLRYLILNAGKQISTTELINHVWPNDQADAKDVWITISYLRQKLRSICSTVRIAGEEGGSFQLEQSGVES
ncbi:MAG TPA: response regulator transcription factor [Candidatus Limosilactobacillus intestinigallinarum]|jgi:DNA-binding response OmpR family regulator|nr:response regulator transcription factor [Candidatus Limosilactobacillus intestinigallinarum]